MDAGISELTAIIFPERSRCSKKDTLTSVQEIYLESSISGLFL